jgi:aminoglycoside phosphotransferase (APT) family kinase protein
MPSMPAAEVDVDEVLVRTLIADQHPDLAGRELTLMANGWDNVMFRLGGDLVVRLPRRALAAELVKNEQKWLPLLAPRLPLPIPVPVRIGKPAPARGYPWSWSIIPFTPGDIAARTGFADPHQAAAALGGFLRALHTEAPADAPVNPARGVPLEQRAEAFAANLAIVGDRVDQRAARTLWQRALDTPRWTGTPVWLHGDLYPMNILVHDGRVSGVIDFGDITSGDPAIDLSIAWSVLPTVARDTFWAAYAGRGGPRADEPTQLRAKGWALAFAVFYLAHSADNPLMEELGRRTYAVVVGE